MSHTFSIAFYNLENLFDPLDNEATLDKDYTPGGYFKWDEEKYIQKIDRLAKVISKIGLAYSKVPPVLLGVCEVEQESCLQDLVQSDHLKPFDYGYVFHRSADARGIHVAFIFQKSHFKVLDHIGFRLDPEVGKQMDPTRDVLHIKGSLFGKRVHLLINHWPSRTDGTVKTNHKRMAAAKLVRDIVDEITLETADANIIIMGDFNDDPLSQSLKPLRTAGFLNPMENFQKQKKGSVKYKGKWMMFDQILFNKNLESTVWWNYHGARIFVQPYLVQKSGRHKGSPRRTYSGRFHQGGYSDHFPVYIYFDTPSDTLQSYVDP